MNGDCGPLQIPGALGQHPTVLFVTASIFFVETSTYHDRGQGRHHPGGPPLTSSSILVVAAAGATGSTSQGGPVIDIFFNFGGGCCQNY
jgi:hypothetical protein